MKIGKSIKLFRTQRELSQNQLAKDANISTSYLCLIENERKNLTLSRLQNICKALDVPITILVFLADEDNEFEKIYPELATMLSQVALQVISKPKDIMDDD